MKTLLLALLFSSSVNACWIELTNTRFLSIDNQKYIVDTNKISYITSKSNGTFVVFSEDNYIKVDASYETMLKLIKCEKSN